MSTNDDIEPRASEYDVRQNLHIEEWDTVGIPPTQVDYYLESRAAPFVEEELGDSDLSEWRLTQIEALLAAHWMAMSNEGQLRQKIRESTSDGASAEYTGGSRTNTGLRETSMGRSAIDLDTSDRLKEIADGDVEEFWHVTRTA